MSAKFLALLMAREVDVLLVEDDEEAARAFEAANFLLKNGKISPDPKNVGKIPVVFPDFRANFGDDLRSYSDEFLRLLSALKKFHDTPNALLITPISSVIHPLPEPLLTRDFCVTEDAPMDAQTLKNALIFAGYEPVDIVEMPGEFSFRGDILDLCFWQDGESVSFRLSFFDDFCEEIRSLDLATQKSEKTSEKLLKIPPALFLLNEENFHKISQKTAEFSGIQPDMASFGLWALGDFAKNLLDPKDKIFISEAAWFFANDFSLDFQNFSDFARFENENFTKNFKNLPPNFDRALEILTLDPKKSGIFIAKNSLLAREIEQKISENLPDPKRTIILQNDFHVNISAPNFVIFSGDAPRKIRQKSRPNISLNELKNGTFVVHRDYGIGIFDGIFTKKILGLMRDFIQIKYANDDTLLLPAHNLNHIDRYVSNAPPVLDRLGRGTFARTKAKIRAKLFEIAEGIIQLAAIRDLQRGEKIIVDENAIKNFQKTAGFTLSDDQRRCISEILNDFASERVMDRFLSGDVGFGKTEVALNAVFAAASTGMQSAVVVPTTLLAFQHFKTFEERLKHLRVAKIDRFVPAKQRTQIRNALKSGEISCVVGTHALLTADFARLGLVVVDEEHRFGVRHKEAIKELSQNVHVLSMSATPIPRTLNMALSHIKSVSQILNPPANRVPVKTFVKQRSDILVRDAIARELRRNGQVIFLHNFIDTILPAKTWLEALVPGVRIAILHSQIDEKTTENVMIDFLRQKYDILLCTTIVESGIHLPNANTIIIERADRFGIADLHQLRGRVGRGGTAGFCYLLYDFFDDLSENARKRLSALEKNSFLGSGMDLARHDLEIRGGGNLLGMAQSGHIRGVGFTMYLRLLEEALNTLTGKDSVEKDVDMNLNLSAFLNSRLIASDAARVELYRRLSFARDPKDVYAIEAEISDRFGEIDAYSARFLELILIKILCKSRGIVKISSVKNSVNCVFEDGQILNFTTREDEDLIFPDILAKLRAI